MCLQIRAAKRIRGTMGNNLQKEMYQRATKWKDETKCSELQATNGPCSSLHFVSSIHLMALWHISFCSLLPVVTRIQPASTTMQRFDNCESHGALFAANGQDVAKEKTHEEITADSRAARVMARVNDFHEQLPLSNGQRRHYGETSVWSWLSFSLFTQPSQRCMP